MGLAAMTNFVQQQTIVGGLVTHDKLATAMAVMMLTPNFFPSCLVQPHHQDANPVGVCWNVQLCLAFYFIF